MPWTASGFFLNCYGLLGCTAAEDRPFSILSTSKRKHMQTGSSLPSSKHYGTVRGYDSRSNTKLKCFLDCLRKYSHHLPWFPPRSWCLLHSWECWVRQFPGDWAKGLASHHTVQKKSYHYSQHNRRECLQAQHMLWDWEQFRFLQFILFLWVATQFSGWRPCPWQGGRN